MSGYEEIRRLDARPHKVVIEGRERIVRELEKELSRAC